MSATEIEFCGFLFRIPAAPRTKFRTSELWSALLKLASKTLCSHSGVERICTVGTLGTVSVTFLKSLFTADVLCYICSSLNLTTEPTA